MRAVILAAGVGSRLDSVTGGEPKVLTRVAGEPLIVRAIRLLARAGVTEAIVVIGYERERVRAALAGSPIPVQFVVNPLYAETQTFFSLMLARPLVQDQPFLKLNGDVIFDQEVLDRLIASPASCAYAVDEHALLDDEAMKVELGDDGRVARVGKGLDARTSFGESIGIEKLSPPFSAALFEHMEAAASAGERALYYEDAFQRAMDEGVRFEPVSVGGLRWTEIDDAEDYARAMRLFEPPRPRALAGVIVVPAGFDAGTPVAGLPPILRHALALAAAGATEIRLVGAYVDVPLDHRLRVPVVPGAPDFEAAIVVRADTTCHRLLPKRLAARPREGDSLAIAGNANAWIAVTGPSRTAGAIAAAEQGRVPGHATEVAFEPGEFVLPAATPDERARAMHPHLKSLVKPTGGVLDRHLMRPISLLMTRALARTPVTPNAVSIVSLALAAAAALLIALDPALVVAGAVVHLFMRIVDCVDGELARLRYQQSRFGEWLDTIGDGFGIAALVAAVAWRAAQDANEPRWLLLGTVGVIAWLTTEALQYTALVQAGGRGSVQYVEWGHRKAGERSVAERLVSAVDLLFRIDVISVLYAALIIAGRLPELLIIHAVAAFGASSYFAAQLFKRRPAVDPDRAQ